MRPANLLLIALFVVQNATYVAYMNDYLTQSAYLATLFAFSGFAGLRLLWMLTVRKRRLTRLTFGQPGALLLVAVATMLSYSLVRDFVTHDRLNTSAIYDSVYIAIPVVVALVVVNNTSLRQLDVYMVILLVRYILVVVTTADVPLGLSAIAQIDWFDSSSPFESSSAHDLLVLEAYFLFRQRRVIAVVSMLFTMVSLKRLSFLAAPALYLWHRRQTGIKPPGARSLVTLFALGVASPFLVMAVYSDWFTSWLKSTFDVDLDEFSMGRRTIYEIVRNYVDSSPGLGSTNAQLSGFVGEHFGTVWNNQLHNDTLRLYLEVGIVCLALYIGGLVLAARSSRLSFLLVTYAMFVLVTSRLITHFSFWIVLFLALAAMERVASETRRSAALPPLNSPAAELEPPSRRARRSTFRKVRT